MRAYRRKEDANVLFHLRRLRQIRRLLGRDVACTLVSAFVLSRVDYCNAVLSVSQVYHSLPLHLYSESLMLLLVSSVVFVRETMSPMH